MTNVRMIRGSRTAGFVLALPLAMLPGTSARANLLTNGDFEADFSSHGQVYCSDPSCTHAIAGWTTTGEAFSTDGLGNTSVNPGNLMNAYLGKVAPAETATLSQSVTTVPGQQYIVTFYLATDGPTLAGSNDDNLDVSFPNSVAGDLLDINLTTMPGPFVPPPGGSYTANTYLPFSYTVTATAAMTAITFTSSNEDGSWLVDDVSIDPVPAAIPEPSPLALLLSALLGLGVFELFRRSKRRSGRTALAL